MFISQGTLLTNIASLLQRCISAGLQVRQPATVEGERSVNTSEVEAEQADEEEGEDEDDEETLDDDDTHSKSCRDDDDEDDVIQVKRIAVRKTTPSDVAGTSGKE